MPRQPLTPEQRNRREATRFSKRILNTFTSAGFLYLPVKNQERRFGLKIGELDAVFLFENVLLICEDTIQSSPREIKEHLRNKNLLFQEVERDKNKTITWLMQTHADKFKRFPEYDPRRYKLAFLYFSKHKLDLSDEDIELYKTTKVIEHRTLNYFYDLTHSIYYSSRSDIFRFLGLKSKDIGQRRASSPIETMESTIICPLETTGHSASGIQVVSFMMSADFLIRNSYVLRKDNWEGHALLFQRLIKKKRIKEIRKHVADSKTAFYNNIIVSLPSNISFTNRDGNPVANLQDLEEFDGYKIQIPDELNSIGIIDGQHRIFAHYEGKDELEKVIAPLRRQIHLLVTGLIFPNGMTDEDQRKYESRIFLDINSNVKTVPADVLHYIANLQDPFSDLSIARQVLVELNKRSAFRDLFQLSQMEKARIKTASIIKFALRYLVTINDAAPGVFYELWKAEKERPSIDKLDQASLREYTEFIVSELDIYFSALKLTYPDEWENGESKILSTTSINGFIMALRRAVKFIESRDIGYYGGAFKKLNINFNKHNFPFTSSQYNKFSIQISKECFDLERDEDGNWKQL